MSNGALYAIAILIWGSTWFAIEFQLGVVEPEISIVYRYVAASALLFGWSFLRGLRLRFAGRAHARFAMLGLLLFSLNYVLAYRAQVHITSALCAVAFSMLLWMNIVNARLFFGVRADRRVLVGATLGILGVLVLFSPQILNVTFNDGVLAGMALALLGALSASFGNIASQHAQKMQLPVVQSNAWGMLYGALWTGAYALATGREFSFDWSAGYVVSLLYLIVFGSIIAFGAYLTLVGRIGAHRAGYATVMFPVVALVLSWLFEGLALDLPTVAGSGLVVAGNLLVLGVRLPRKFVRPRHGPVAPQVSLD